MSACPWCEAEECDCKERASCKLAGRAGHQFCGTCPEHACPRSVCHCGAELKKPEAK